MAHPAQLTRGLHLLDALHQVQGAAAVEETPEALADLLTQMCAQQAIVAAPEQIGQAVALYQAQREMPALSRAPIAQALSQAVNDRPARRPWGPRGWWTLSLAGTFAAATFLIDGLVGAIHGNGWLGIAADLMMVPPLLWVGVQAMERSERRLTAQPGGTQAFLDRFTRQARGWEHGTWRHPMETQPFTWARVTSADVFKLKSPYPGRQRLRLQMVEDPHTGQAAVALLLKRGQFDVCSQIRVRFDDEEAQYWAVGETSAPPPLREAFPNQGRLLFLRDAGVFLATLAQHQSVTLEVPFYSNGTRMIRFSAMEKGWSPQLAWADQALRTRPPISRQWRVRPPLREGITQREVASDNTLWIEDRYNAHFVRLECHVRQNAHSSPAIQVGFFIGEGGLQDATSSLRIEGRPERRTRLTLEDTRYSPAELFTPHRFREGMYAWLDEVDDLVEALTQGHPFSIDVVLRQHGRLTFTFSPPAVADLTADGADSTPKPGGTYPGSFAVSSTVDPAWWHRIAVAEDQEDDPESEGTDELDFLEGPFFDDLP